MKVSLWLALLAFGSCPIIHNSLGLSCPNKWFYLVFVSLGLVGFILCVMELIQYRDMLRSEPYIPMEKDAHVQQKTPTKSATLHSQDSYMNDD